MPAFQVNGLASGLDTANIIKQLMSIERRPLQRLQQRENDLNQKVELFQNFNTILVSLKDAATTIGDSDTLEQVSVTSSDPDSLGAEGTASANLGSFLIDVDQLAAQTQTISQATDISDPNAVISGLTSGDLAITVNGTTVNVTYDATTDTLYDIRDAINQADAGASASVIYTGSDYRLMITGTQQGASNAVQLADANGGNLKSRLVLASDDGDPLTGTPDQAASDSQIQLAGVTITRSSNVITDVLDGVTLTLKAITTSSVTVDVSSDASANLQQIQDFVDAINDYRQFVIDQTKFQEGADSQAPLFGDSTVLGIDSALRSILSTRFGSLTSITSLAQLGITFDTGTGKYTVGDRVEELLNEDPTGVKNLLAAVKDALTKTDRTGTLDRIVDTIDGRIKTKTDFLQSEIQNLQDTQDRMEKRLAQKQTLLERQFNQLETLMAQLQSQSQFFMGQLANLSGGSGGSGTSG